ncbi:hypothetical protein [Bauldia sp.]|uniref:hypothetical protein n=1 Tax=Bauldia sp. TaxID=2575872 RepID=UPI003BAC4958
MNQVSNTVNADRRGWGLFFAGVALLVMLFSAMEAQANKPDIDFNCENDTECDANYYISKGSVTIRFFCYGVALDGVPTNSSPYQFGGCHAPNINVSCIDTGHGACFCTNDVKKTQRITAKIKHCCAMNHPYNC